MRFNLLRLNIFLNFSEVSALSYVRRWPVIGRCIGWYLMPIRSPRIQRVPQRSGGGGYSQNENWKPVPWNGSRLLLFHKYKFTKELKWKKYWAPQTTHWSHTYLSDIKKIIPCNFCCFWLTYPFSRILVDFSLFICLKEFSACIPIYSVGFSACAWDIWWSFPCRRRLFKIIRDWILLVCFSWRYEATEGPRVNFVMREALFEIYTWILCRFIPTWETNK